MRHIDRAVGLRQSGRAHHPAGGHPRQGHRPRRVPGGAGRAWAAPAGRGGEPAAGAAVGGRLPGKVAAEEQEATADEEEQAEQGLAGHEAAVGEPEDPGREETEPDEGGGEDAKDGADHVEDAERFERKVRGLPMPVMVIAGREDETGPWNKSLPLVEMVHDVEFHVLPFCGHVPQYDQPDALVALLSDFLARKGAPAAAAPAG